VSKKKNLTTIITQKYIIRRISWYARADGALEDSSAIIKEGDVEDQELDMELGKPFPIFNIWY